MLPRLKTYNSIQKQSFYMVPFLVSRIDASEAANIFFYVKVVFFACLPASWINAPEAENMHSFL